MPFEEEIQILKTTPDYIAIYKPPGIAFHSTEDHGTGILPRLRDMESAGVIPSGDRIFPVHRLDRVTSGILLFARGRKNTNQLGNEFRHGRVEKVYLALSDRKPIKKQGWITGDMQKGRNGAWILLRTRKNPAVTRFFSFSIPGRRPGLRLYLLRPSTGKTHQLRVAMKSNRTPILGDPLYSQFDLAREEDRTYLHACALRFELNGKVETIVVPPRTGAEFQSEQFLSLYSSLGDLFSYGLQESKKKPSAGSKHQAQNPSREKQHQSGKKRSSFKKSR